MREDIDNALRVLETIHGVLGYAIVKPEGIVVCSKFKEREKTIERSIPLLNKMIKTFKNLGKTFGDTPARYSLMLTKEHLFLMVPIDEVAYAFILLSRDANVNEPYKSILSVKDTLARLIEGER